MWVCVAIRCDLVVEATSSMRMFGCGCCWSASHVRRQQQECVGIRTETVFKRLSCINNGVIVRLLRSKVCAALKDEESKLTKEQALLAHHCTGHF